MLDRLAEGPASLFEGLWSRLVEEVDTLQERRMGLRNDGAGRRETALVLRRERRLDLAADGERSAPPRSIDAIPERQRCDRLAFVVRHQTPQAELLHRREM